LATLLSYGSRADALEFTDFATLSGLFDFGGAVTPPGALFSDYQFTGDTPPSGAIFSAAVAGLAGGEAEGTYLYLYQIYASSTRHNASAMNVDFPSFVVLPSQGDGFLACVDCGGDVSPSSAGYNPVFDLLRFNFQDSDFNGTLSDGMVSWIFGAVSSLPPGIAGANVFNSEPLVSKPGVVAPVPEPTSLFLIGSGLLALGLGRRRRS